MNALPRHKVWSTKTLRLGAKTAIALKVLLGVLIDVALFVIAVHFQISSQVFKPLVQGVVLVGIGLLVVKRYRAIGGGMLLGIVLIMLFLVSAFVYFEMH